VEGAGREGALIKKGTPGPDPFSNFTVALDLAQKGDPVSQERFEFLNSEMPFPVF
jgi:hypothetical protein